MSTTYYQPKRLDKLTNKEKVNLLFDLIHAFKIVRTPEQTALLLSDLLTANEISNISKRLRIGKLLLNGKTHREIADELHCSFVTVSKVRNWLNNGGEGLKYVIKNLPTKYEMPKKLSKKPLEFQLPQLIFAGTQAIISKNQSKSPKKLLAKTERKKYADRELHEIYKDKYRK
jgi:TrpR-related protein YerC/YecD